MRRKKISIHISELTDDIRSSLVGFINDRFNNVDINSITITGMEQHEYTPRTFGTFIENIRLYVDINGNKVVNKRQLAKIGKITRPTLDKMIQEMLVVPRAFCECGVINRDYYIYYMKHKEELSYIEHDRFDLCEIIESARKK